MKNMIFKTITAVSTVMTGEAPWWTGAPTKLLKKTTLVHGIADVAALQPGNMTNLPVHTLTFQIPKNMTYSGKARPHNTIRMDLGDVVKMVIPGYKPKSYSVSALRDDEFDITFKVYPNGRASGFLDRLQEGDLIGSFGMHCGKTRRPGSFVGLIAYGVGITEAWPIARAELEKGDAQKVVLLWASRTEADTFWSDEIEEFQQAYPDKLQVVNIFSREEVKGSLHGRVDAEVLREVFHEADGKNTRFLSVGTKPMMKQTSQMLEDIGFPMPEHALLAKA